MQSTRMNASRLLGSFALAALALTVMATPAMSQTVSLYRGTLAIGFGDPENLPGGTRVSPAQPLAPDLANNGLPACAKANPYLPATLATLDFFGFATQGTSSPASVMFGGYAPLNITAMTGGGQPPITQAGNPGCVILFPPWLGNQLRSRVQQGAQVWPGNAINAAHTAVTGPAGGTVSAGGGVGVTTSFAPAAFYQTGMTGAQAITPGPNNFGGGVPVNNNGAVQLGVNLAFTNGTGQPLATFGVQDYAEGFLPSGPAIFGTGGTDTQVPVGVRVSFPYTWRVHTPGPTTTNMATTPLAVQLPFTPNLGWSHGATQTLGGGTLLTTPGLFKGIFQKWTTGRVFHMDISGMYVTDRTATGHDWTTGQFASMGTSAPAGTTRKLQLVTPWSASIQQDLTRPWAGLIASLPDFGFGGVAVLSLDLQPAPEPGALSMLAFGAAGLMGLGALRRRSG